MLVTFKEYLRPWKLITWFLGLTALIEGSYYYHAPDWDVPISVIMGLLAYLTAPWSLKVILDRKYRYFPLMLFFVWFSVDGCYWIYWHFENYKVLEQMREANFFASLSLYGMCGIIWLYQGSLRQLVKELKVAFKIY